MLFMSAVKSIGLLLVLLLFGCSKPTVVELYRDNFTDLEEESNKNLEFKIRDLSYKLSQYPGESFPEISQKISGDSKWNIILSRKNIGSYPNIGLGLFAPSKSGNLIAFSTIPSFSGIWIKKANNDELKFIPVPDPNEIIWSDSEEDVYITQRVGQKIQKVLLSRSLEPPTQLFSVSDIEQVIFTQNPISSSGFFIELRSPKGSEIWFVSFGTSLPMRIFKTDKPSKLYASLEDGIFRVIEIQPNGKNNVFNCGKICESFTSSINELLIEDLYFFNRFAIIKHRINGQARIAWYDFKNNSLQNIQLPFNSGSISIIKKTASETRITLELSSWLSPTSSYEAVVGSKELNLISSSRLSPEINSSDFLISEEEILAKDGSLIPISIIEPKYADVDRKLVLMVYGAYEKSYDPYFSTRHLTLLKAGIGIAVAHVRGGAEKGRGWSEAASLGRKMVGVSDLIDVANWLKDRKKAKLALLARSAGGLLAARAMIESPYLFDAVALEVPFVNVEEQLVKDPDSRDDYEWGSLENDLEKIRSYDPITNLKMLNYPSVFISAHEEDAEVPINYISKFKNKLDEVSSGKIVFRVYSNASHSNFSSKKLSRMADAEVSGFLLEELSE